MVDELIQPLEEIEKEKRRMDIEEECYRAMQDIEDYEEQNAIECRRCMETIINFDESFVDIVTTIQDSDVSLMDCTSDMPMIEPETPLISDTDFIIYSTYNKK